MLKILMITDKEAVAEELTDALQREGYEVSHVPDGKKGINAFYLLDPDLILLDRHLPGRSGMEVCHQIRQDHSVPIIVLSSMADVADKVTALSMGADDYVTIPFDTPELIARIGAVLRRCRSSKPPSCEYLTYHQLQMNLVSRRLIVRGEVVELTRREFDLLNLFMRSPGRVFTREALLSHVWGETDNLDDQTIAVHVRWLRKKIEDNPRQPRYIQTLYGVGYRFGD